VNTRNLIAAAALTLTAAAAAAGLATAAAPAVTSAGRAPAALHVSASLSGQHGALRNPEIDGN
jgi:hypothetical protein